MKDHNGLTRLHLLLKNTETNEKQAITVLIKPSGEFVIQQIVPGMTSISAESNNLMIEQSLLIEFSETEAYNNFIKIKPELSDYKVQTCETKKLPHQIQQELTLVGPDGSIQKAILLKDVNGNIRMVYDEEEKP